MFLATGYVYHIKDEYFEFTKDEKLMKNHENGNTRPTYFCIKNTDAYRCDGANDQALYNNSGQPMWVFHQIDDTGDDYRCRYVFVQYGGTKAQVWRSSTYNDDLSYSGGVKVWGDEMYKFTFTYHGQEHPVSCSDRSKTRCETWLPTVDDYYTSDIGRELRL